MTTHELPQPKELTPEQREYWERQLINSERAVAYARKMLGIVAVESRVIRDE